MAKSDNNTAVGCAVIVAVVVAGLIVWRITMFVRENLEVIIPSFIVIATITGSGFVLKNRSKASKERCIAEERLRNDLNVAYEEMTKLLDQMEAIVNQQKSC